MSRPVVHPRVPQRRGAARATTWWGKAWVRAVEEAAYAEADLKRARAMSRSGRVGQIAVDAGTFVAAVEDDRGLWTVAGTVSVLDGAGAAALVETVAAEAGRIAALMAGHLPHTLVEHAEEAGVELLPYGGELGSTCSCEAWLDPCAHALAVLYQLSWLLEADPFVLLHLRGVARDDLLAALHARRDQAAPVQVGGVVEVAADGVGFGDGDRDDVETGLDAALRAARLLELIDDPDQAVDHLI